MNQRPARAVAAAAMLLATATAPYAHKKDETVRLPLEGNNQRRLMVTVEFERRRALVIVDTGSTATMIDADAFHLNQKPSYTVLVPSGNQRIMRAYMTWKSGWGKPSCAGM